MTNNIQSKQINGFERYIINSVGIIYDTKTKRNICQWVDNVGYFQCNLYDENNKKYGKVVSLMGRVAAHIKPRELSA